MKVNRGKDFEKQVKKAMMKNPDISFDRFPDPMAGYAGVRNICDFGVYYYPFQYYLECKAVSGNTLNFKSAITEDQWNGLYEKSKIPGVIAGVLIWFIDWDITTFISIQQLAKLKQMDCKSLNIRDIKDDKVLHFPLSGIKKRVLFDYDITKLLIHLATWNSRGLSLVL